MKYNKYIIFIFLIITSFTVFSQTDYDLKESYLIENYIKELNKNYIASLSKKNNYKSGRLSREISLSKYNHPYYLDNDWHSGIVFHDTSQYQVPAIKFDIYKDRILFLNQINNNAFPVNLNNMTVKKFIIDTSTFIYLSDFGKKNNSIFKPGYYEVLYKGNTSLYMRWEKYKRIDNSSRTYEYKKNIYFALYKNGKYRKFKNEIKLRILLRDEKSQIKSYLKKNKLYHNDLRTNAQKLVKFYDSLTNK
ncbi:hypothetical protein ACFLTE_00475 [Bacteroidota bacterium]